MQYVYPAIITPEDKGGFCVHAPDLPGCVSSGETIAEAIENIRDGIGGFLFIMSRNNSAFPNPSSQNDLKTSRDDIVTLVDVDLDAYKRRHNTRDIKRTISLPGWLDEMAEGAGLSLSQITQEALRRKFNIAE